MLGVFTTPTDLKERRIMYTVHLAGMKGRVMDIRDICHNATTFDEAVTWARENMVHPYVILESRLAAISEGVIKN